MEVRTQGWVGDIDVVVFYLVFLSVIGQRSWHHALWGSLQPAHLLLSCLHVFVHVKDLFFCPFLWLSEQRRPLRQTAQHLATASPHPTLNPKALSHYSNSIHSRLFIQYWQSREMLMVGVKAYINYIKHTHTRRSKCWFWQTAMIAHRLNKLFVGDWPQGSGCRSEASWGGNRNSGQHGFPNSSFH